MTANSNPPASPSSSTGNFTVVFLLVVVFAGAFYYFAQTSVDEGKNLLETRSSRGGLAVGNTAPEIKAAGWIDGKDPGTLAGKVLIVEAWATWCLPCRNKAPEMVETWQKYADRDDVIFIGLTTETEDSVPAIKSFLDEFNISWPNGYGATETLVAFRADYIPSAWVIDKKGKIIWTFDSDEDMSEAIEKALNQQ